MLPSGTITFLFTDIESSTPLWEREPKPMRLALERHHAILRAAIESHGGYVYKTIGDAFQAAFAIPAQALEAALATQRGLAAQAWETSNPLRVRIGLHVGPAEAAGSDYATTHTLNRVARITSAGYGGQILLSVEVAELMRSYLPADVTLRDMGQHRMKGLTQLEHLFQVVVPDLPADFPPLKSLDTFPNNLPVQLTSFVGREKEIAEVKQLLDATRLLTLTGPGGTGKTRLSLQVAADVLPSFPDGVWFIELAPLADPSLAVQIMASALELREQFGRSLADVITDYLRGKISLLLLDNCEHLVETCAKLADDLLHACPRLKIMASSREVLGVAGETAYRVPSLSLPDVQAATQCESVRLFVERATAAQSRFALTESNARAVAQTCQRLDGIPLALELAAARVKVLSVEQIAARLDDRFRLLTGGSRTALPRQQTLRALIDWSYSLLSEQERILFRRLAVFIGGWTLEAAEAVCASDGIESDEVLDLLTRLVDKSLVIMEEQAGEARYRRLETIRQYSREKFLEADAVEAVRDRHLAFYLQFAETGEIEVQGRERSAWMRRLEAEHDNLRAALEWGLAREPDSALRIVGALLGFWAPSSYAVEGHTRTRQALARVEALPALTGEAAQQRLAAQAKALRGVAFLSISQGDNVAGRLAAEKSVALYRQLDDRRELALTLVMLAMSLEFLGEGAQAEKFSQESLALARAMGDAYITGWALNMLARVTAALHGDFEAARRYVEESIRLSREAGISYLVAGSAQMLGTIAAYRNDYVEARARFEEAIPLFRETAAPFNVTLVLSDLAHLERRQGNHARALELYRETIVAFQKAGQRGAVAHQLECFAFIAGAQEQFSRAARLLGAAEALRENTHLPMAPYERPEHGQHLAAIRERLDSDAFTVAWAGGRRMTMEQAVDAARALKETGA